MVRLPDLCYRKLWLTYYGSEMQYIFETLRQNGHNTDKLWEDIKEAITKSFLAGEQRITTAISRIVHYRSNGYELLGFDFLVDENMKPWLLEVNHAPNLEPHTELETKVKVRRNPATIYRKTDLSG
jgi:hypothetical protein